MNVLIMRFSAMGDVALLAAACKAWLTENPNAKITILTRKNFSSFFSFSINVTIIAPDFKGKHKGFFGLFRLFKEIHTSHKFDYIVDAHDVLRTQVLRKFFKLTGSKISIYKKDRKAKKQLTNRDKKVRGELTHTVQRYLDVFPGKKVEWKDAYLPILSFTKNKQISSKIGIAPFSQHPLKVVPIKTMKEVLLSIAADADVYLFGDKEKEYQDLLALKGTHKQVKIASELCANLQEELALIAQMEVMLCMDSANMHMAALVGTPVVSLWGSTHPDLGFKALGKGNDALQIQVSTDELPCRPCSVFGNTTCYRGDQACLTRITAASIVEKLRTQI